MNKQQGMEIVEGLRQAKAAGSPVIELTGDDARNFNFVTVEEREQLLGSFCVEQDKRFFILVASTPRSAEDFQFMVYEKLKGSPVLTTKSANASGVVWTYSTSKQSGDNQARKRAFVEAAQSESLTIPFPSDIVAFSASIVRAIELRRIADAAGALGDDEVDEEIVGDEQGEELGFALPILGLYPNRSDFEQAARFMAESIRFAHNVTPTAWAIHVRNGNVHLSVCALRVLELRPSEIGIFADATKIATNVRELLGSKIRLNTTNVKNPYAQVTTSPAVLTTLPAEVRIAHLAFITHAATTSLAPNRPPYTPFSAYHVPSLLEELEEVLGEKLPRPAYPRAAEGRYWKISPGKQGVNWVECRNGGFIGIGWNKLGDISQLTEDEFSIRAEEQGASDQVWTFRNISIGDRIVANQGTKLVLGIGTVVGKYYFDDNGGTHKHRLPVRWDDTTKRAVIKKGWVKTVIPIKPGDFAAITNASPAEDSVKLAIPAELSQERDSVSFDAILEQLREASLSFSAELVASYLLALQAKRFVLLTGISGTGKTQLALEVARAFDEALVDLASDDTESSADTFEITAKPYQLNHGRFIVPSELAQTFDALSDPDSKRIDLKLPGMKKESMALYKNADRGNLFYVLLSGEAKTWFKANIKLGDRYRLSRQTSGEAEWIELQLSPRGRARPTAPAGRTFATIAVRPNWTDKSEILGFYNPLTNSYQSTKILDFLLRAHAEVEASESEPRPYFLIFDEMNLARVEHYFSDFLSAMESGQPIDLHDDQQLEDSQGIPRHLTIPKNLFVVGTVNIDETTYMFSPKVLDRAFVLEFNDVNFDGIGNATIDEDPSSTPLALEGFERLEILGKPSEEEWQAFERLLDGELLARLKKVHVALAAEHRHFGYRVAREIARFVNLAVAQTGHEAAGRAAFDVAVLAKVLPKLHGSQSELEESLRTLLAIAIDKGPLSDSLANASIPPELFSEIPLPRSARKLSRMLRRLTARGFVSYIE